MTVKNSLIYITTFLTFTGIYSQTTKKVLQTKFIDEKITIDGKFTEGVWKTAAIATDFIMLLPNNGEAEKNKRRSEVKVVYDNEAVYVAATMYDDEPTKILKELTLRDDFGSADHFGFFINGYNDGQQEFRFFVSAAGVQQDCIYTEANGEDFTWNAIWDSKTSITDYGWTIELKIPYAALRFSDEKKQTWGLNMYREVYRDRFQYTWNLIDINLQTEANQAGILEGIENIETPTRLFLIPYTSYYVSANDSQKVRGEFKGGLDVKYGINDAFTLDAILVPDFGQAAFDRVELNLGPFEQQFVENRPFFTEGTDLFNKGNLFYSRRIGGEPSLQPTLSDDEEFVKYSSVVNLLNALKVSGRTKSSLGIGVLNAITERTDAVIRNNVTGETRIELIEPLANFNLFVLDQRFMQNSSVSFINTNVTRNGEFRDANVSALIYDLNTKKNTFNLSGDFKFSHVNDYQVENRNGYNTTINVGKTKGKYRYSIGGQYVSNEWDNNDLGINFQTNYHSIYSNSSYRILKPNKTFNTFNVQLNLYSEFNNVTGSVQESSANLNFNTTNKKNDYHGFGLNSRLTDVYDYYEPRSANNSRFIIVPKSIRGNYFFSSNYAKKFALDVGPSFTFFDEKDRINFNLFVSPRYRFSDRFLLIYSSRYIRQVNDIGWIDFDSSDNTIFAKRNRNTYTNTLSGKYAVNDLITFNLSVRHYWSYAINNEILTLKDDGTLETNLEYDRNRNSNFNTWNMDLSFSWWFAPGSQMSILYRNNSSLFTREFNKEIGSNFREAINQENLNHILSVSIRYFIDYNTAKNWFLNKKTNKN
jgi:hypothetical protein